MLKKYALWLIVLLMLSSGIARADAEMEAPESIEVAARAAILIEAESGRVLMEQNADTRYPMASTTKIMTALIAVEHCSMDEIVTAGKNASGVEGTSIYLSEGEQLTMHQMLQGLMLRSGNDAAVAIAEHIAGDVKTFAELMNARAEMLGADAVFVTPNGLDSGDHGASARAMALIARAAMGYPVFRELVRTQRAVIPWVDNEYSRVLQNKNRLLSEYEGATGIKTGFTSKAGRCLVFSAERDGMELIGVVLNCGAWFDEAEKMLDWGFENFSLVQAAQQGEVVAHSQVTGGTEESAAIAAAQPLRYPIGKNDVWSVETYAADSLKAPLQAGDVAGYMTLIVNGQEAARTELIAQNDVPERTLIGTVREWFNFIPFFREN